jgi:hypothetical protein
MTNERERLEDAFTRAEGYQEVAFRNWHRASRRNAGPLIAFSLTQGKRAYAALVEAAANLSQKGK